MTYYGETPTTDGGYTVVRFLQSGDFVTPAGVTSGEVLLVGGGGSGAADNGNVAVGGGGAGGYISDTVTLSGTMGVVVGTGGAAISAPTKTLGNNGLDSTFADLTAYGGGGGGRSGSGVGSGGSGGGGGDHDSGGSGTGGQGYAGGTGGSGSGAGGGGASELGHNGSGNAGGAGGAGTYNDITGTSLAYAGGGGGNGMTSGGAGGAGGGGAGTGNSTPATAGTDYLGGGGGGTAYWTGWTSGKGGIGIVIIRYLAVSNEGIVTLGAVRATGAGKIYLPCTETEDGEYTLRVYDTPGSGLFKLPFGWQEWMVAETLIVGGGGGGGGGDTAAGGGGGGAGGYLAASDTELAGDVVITVGVGGLPEANGADSVLDSIIAYGGGYGALTAGNGGSGGGATATSSSGDHGAGYAGPPRQGYDGGSSVLIGAGETGGGGGGGGATAVGANSAAAAYQGNSAGGHGGAGAVNDITGSSLTYAVGGDGADATYLGGAVSGADGTNGRGNGGEGAFNSNDAGTGGAGVIVIRFITPENKMHVTLGSVRATGSAWVSAAYTGIGTSTLGVVRVAGSGTNPTYGSGRLTLGPVKIPLGISANTLYLRGDVRIYVGTQSGDLVTGLAANCRISVAGEEDWAWLRDTGEIISLEADCTIRVAERGDTLLNTSSLPATDALGWTVPDRDTPALRGFVVTLAGKRVNKNLIKDLTIDLSDRGGYDRATLVLDKSVRVGQAAMLSILRVTYKNTVLFRGRLEARGPTLGHDMQHALTFTGPIVKLKDHRGFRRVYADSDLSSWQTGQGPNTSANVFEVQGS